ncbi:MAG: protein TolQ, partial [Beijerinckiaceae bacterium]
MTPVDVVSSDLSLWGLFWQAHPVVKLVMIGLIAASIWCWGIIIDKTILYSRTRRAMDQFEDVFWSGQSLEDLYRNLSQGTPRGMAAVFVSAMREWKRTFENGGRAVHGLSLRIDKVLDVTIQREAERLESKLLVLA